MHSLFRLLSADDHETSTPIGLMNNALTLSVVLRCMALDQSNASVILFCVPYLPFGR